MIQDSLSLPQRFEKIVEIELNEADQALYHFFREKTAKIAAGLAGRDASKTSEGKSSNILTLINFLRRICNSGEDLLPKSAMEAWKTKSSASVDWQMMQNCNSKCDLCGVNIEDADSVSDDSPKFDCNHSICTACSTQTEETPIDEARQCPKCAATQVRFENSPSPSNLSTRLSAKVEAMIQNLSAEQQTLDEGKSKAPPMKR